MMDAPQSSGAPRNLAVAFTLRRSEMFCGNFLLILRRPTIYIASAVAGALLSYSFMSSYTDFADLMGYAEPWLQWLKLSAEIWGGIAFIFVCTLVFAIWKHGAQPLEIGVTPERITVKTLLAEASIDWRGFRQVFRIGSFLVLRLKAQGAYLIPRRAFDSDTAFADFANLVTSYWKAANATS